MLEHELVSAVRDRIGRAMHMHPKGLILIVDGKELLGAEGVESVPKD